VKQTKTTHALMLAWRTTVMFSFHEKRNPNELSLW